jgi:hypothetical protein
MCYQPHNTFACHLCNPLLRNYWISADAIRPKHYTYRTEETYVQWIRR